MIDPFNAPKTEIATDIIITPKPASPNNAYAALNIKNPPASFVSTIV